MKPTHLILLTFSLMPLQAADTAPSSFRLMTFNIHHGEGTDGKVDLERIAKVMGEAQADIVALQEVDRGASRTGQRQQEGRDGHHGNRGTGYSSRRGHA